MYIGSTDSRGLMHCLWEIIDNSVDEALGGHGRPDRGHAARRRLASRCATTAAASRSTSSRRPGCPASRSSSPSCTRAASSAVAPTRRPADCTGSAPRWSTRCPRGSTSRSTATARRGRCRSTAASPGCSPTGRAAPDAPFTPFVSGAASLSRRQGARASPARASGTGRTGRSSPRAPTSRPTSWSTRARQTAFLVPGLTLGPARRRGLPARATARTRRRSVHDGRHRRVRRLPRAGRAGHRHLAAARDRHVHRDGAGARRRGHMTPTEVERECQVDVALRWGTGYDTEVRSFVNIIATPKGGTHHAGFEQGDAQDASAPRSRRTPGGSRSGDGRQLEKDDILAGLTAVLTVRLPEPQFEGQTKEILGTPAVRNIVAAGRRARAGVTCCARTKRDDKAQAAARARQDRRRDEAPDLRPRAQGDSAPQERPRDARRCPPSSSTAASTTSTRSELFIVEGDSALGTAKLGARQRVPGAAADPRQDPQRAEGVAWPTCSRTPSARRSSR